MRELAQRFCNMKTLKNIIKQLSEAKEHLVSQYPIKTVAIFGSFARNEANQNSDLDIIVEINGPIGSRFIDLADELESILQQKVDLVSKNGIKTKYFEAIKKDLIYV